jgi:uncharacterized protein (TIGR04206 family)
MGPNFVLDKGFIADTPVEKFRFVKLVDTEHVERADGAGYTVGVVQNHVDQAAVDDGQVNDVRVLGISRVIAGSDALAIGTPVASDAQGRAVPVGAGTAVGICWLAADAVGDHVDVLLTPATGV